MKIRAASTHFGIRGRVSCIMPDNSLTPRAHDNMSGLFCHTHRIGATLSYHCIRLPPVITVTVKVLVFQVEGDD